jgi:hypothetical protein
MSDVFLALKRTAIGMLRGGPGPEFWLNIADHTASATIRLEGPASGRWSTVLQPVSPSQSCTSAVQLDHNAVRAPEQDPHPQSRTALAASRDERCCQVPQADAPIIEQPHESGERTHHARTECHEPVGCSNHFTSKLVDPPGAPAGPPCRGYRGRICDLDHN